MRSSDVRALALAVALSILTTAAPAAALENALGHSVDRLSLSAPGAGWFAMDALDMRGRVSGTFAMTLDYAHDSVHLPLPVVRNQLVTKLGLAATYDRFRGSLEFDLPLVATGSSGTFAQRRYTAPDVDPSKKPDTIGDVRLGLDARLHGGPDEAFRAGLGLQLFVPSGDRADYVTDHTYRAMARLLVAGDVGHFSYAGHVGAHVRPLSEPSVPGSPRGSELLFGVAGGAKFLPGATPAMRLVIGPELYGSSAFEAFLGRSTTALEALLGARLEGTAMDRPQLRLKIGAGTGNARFGTPDVRAVVGLEVFESLSRR